MNRTEMVHNVSIATGVSLKLADQALDEIFRTIQQGLAEHGEARVTGFGYFTRIDRPARTGRNPRTGETMTIAASSAVRFKAARKLKAEVSPAPATPAKPARRTVAA